MSFNDDRTHVRVHRVGLLECYPWWNKDRRCDSWWRLYANGRCGAAVIHGERTMALDAQSVVLVPAWCSFGTTISGPGVGHFYIHFDVLNLSRPLTEQWFPHPMAFREAGLRAVVDAARDEFLSNRPATLLCAAKAAVYSALGKAMDGLPVEVQERWTDLVEGGSPLSRALRFIEDHLAESITVDDMAARSFLGRDQFSRVFRQAFGQSPHHYLVDRRLAAAAQLLAWSGDALDTIAERCGFTDRGHLSRLFVRRFGITPAAYRKAREGRGAGLESRAVGE